MSPHAGMRHVAATSAAAAGSAVRKTARTGEIFMSGKAGWLAASVTLAAVATTMSLGAGPAHAVVYCKTVGVPKGCVVRPAAEAVVVAPAAAGVVATPGVGVRAGTPMNRGGPVNRVGVR
jgi:hypothetical protein